jgi:tetratricopeptide (TPR) repeat protein
LSDVPLHGEAAIAALAKLEACYESVLASWLPARFDLLGDTGLGKTLVVRELYRRLAAGDPYWPAALVDSNHQRKAVVPLRERWEGEPCFYWLGLSCYPARDGSPAPVLEDSLRHQLRVHARGLLIRRQRKIAARQAALKAAVAIGELLGAGLARTLIELFGDARDTKEIIAALHAGASGHEGSDSEESLVRAVLEVTDLINADGLPMVVVVDDAHDAHPTTLAAVERLLSSPRGVLVITTSWSTALIRQRYEGGGFGAWRERVAAAHRVQTLRLKPLSTTTLADIATSAAPGSTAAGSIDREAALTLAARANGNPLALSGLLKLASRNGLALRAQDIADLKVLPRDPVSLLREEWERILPDRVQRVLEIAAVLGTPIDERMLMGGLHALSGAGRSSLKRSVEEAVRLAWMVPIFDPYGPGCSLRFAEADRREMAEHNAGALIGSSRDRLVVAAVEQALSPPKRTSFHARTAAMLHAEALLEEQMPPQAVPLAVSVYRILAVLLSNSDPLRSAHLMDLAMATHAKLGESVDLELLDDTAHAWHKAGDGDRALTVFDATLPLALALKAQLAWEAERCAEAIEVAYEGVCAELAEPGSVAPILMPMSQHDSVLVSLAEVLASANVLAGYTMTDKVRPLLWEMIRRATKRGRAAETAEVARIAFEEHAFGEADLAGLEELRVPAPVLPSSPFAAEQDAVSLENAAELLAQGDLDAADLALKGMDTRTESRQAVPVAEILVGRGGARYAQSLASLTLQAGDYGKAARAYQLALHHRIEKETPYDLPSLAPLRVSLAEALAWSGDGERALAVATECLQIALRAADPEQLVPAQVALAHAHIALEQYADARRVLNSATERLTPAVGMVRVFKLRIEAALCETYGMQGDWAGVVELFEALPSAVAYGDERHNSWRLRGWCAAARWRLAGKEYACALLTEAGLDPRSQWAEATSAALEHLAASMTDQAAGASRKWAFDLRAWLVEAVEEAGYGEQAAGMATVGRNKPGMGARALRTPSSPGGPLKA